MLGFERDMSRWTWASMFVEIVKIGEKCEER